MAAASEAVARSTGATEAMTFETAIKRVLSHEGGYVFDPRDRGGETHWGISKRAHPELNIRDLTREAAIEVYKADYWNKLPVDVIPSSLVFQLFDMAVNHGVTAAIKALQRSVGVKDDGRFGPVTLAAVRRMRSTDLVILLNAERLETMTELSVWPAFSRGWTKRVVQNLRWAVEDDKRDG